jgi:hypothetical protein
VDVLKLRSRILPAVLLVFIRILGDIFHVHNTDFEQCFETLSTHNVLGQPKSSQRMLIVTACTARMSSVKCSKYLKPRVSIYCFHVSALQLNTEHPNSTTFSA